MVAAGIAMSALASAAPAIDLSTLRLFVGADDERAVLDFLQRFFTRLDADMTRMRDTIERQRWGDVKHITHQMHSSALTIGASDFALLCAAFEQVRHGFDGQLVAARFGALECSFNQVRRAVKVALVDTDGGADRASGRCNHAKGES